MHLQTQKQIKIILDENEAEDLYNYLVLAADTSGIPCPQIVSDMMKEFSTEGDGR